MVVFLFIMSLYQNRYRIEPARLKEWDYSSKGYYYITICTKNRIHHFGRINNGKLELSEIGRLAHKYWMEIPDHFPNSQLDKFVIMPNHIHGIIAIDNDKSQRLVPDGYTTGQGGLTGNNNPMHHQSISTIIRWYKGRCTFEINKRDNKIIDTTTTLFRWHPRFYDHIIRTGKDLIRIRTYIQNNPKNWAN